jgi:hypothetical protein
MLSQAVVDCLSSLAFRPDAERQSCAIPLAGIYWDNEMPDLRIIGKLSEEDRNQVFQLFGIRMKIWDQETLKKEDQQFWDTARSQIPNYALFQRLELSVEDRKAQEIVFNETVEGLQSWFSSADKAEISKDK